MPRLVALDGSSPVAPFEQVRVQLAAQIGAGTLVVGTKLPTVRRLAEDLGLAVNTVAKAYRELESAGLVETRGRLGTVVTAAGVRARERLRIAAQKYASLASDIGVPADEAVRAVRAAFDAADY